MGSRGHLSLAQTANYAFNTLLLGGSVAQYWGRYFASRHFDRDQDFYVVYTDLDHSIPFQPESSSEYWKVNLRLVPAAVRLGDPTICGDFAAVRHAYVRMAAEGCAAFTQVPTIMPIMDGSGGTALHLARAMLKPTNCCPSLHTAAPFFAYNAAASHFPEKREQLRQCVADVVSTVIKAKFHAIMDVSFGILLAKKAVEDDLRLDFDDLETYFTQCQKNKDNVPYENVYQVYREICRLSKAMGPEGDGVAGLMRQYFREMDLPLVKRRQSNCFYDLKRRTLVYPEQLKVGKGLL